MSASSDPPAAVPPARPRKVRLGTRRGKDPASAVTAVEPLLTAVVEAAAVSAALWFSYLFVLLYLGLAVVGITHRDLLLESAVKLPFLSVDLPLISFFAIGPAMFLIVHAYVLLHFVLLAQKVGLFDAALRHVKDAATRAALRRRLPSNIFAQFLAGPREVRHGIVGLMLRGIAGISLVCAPLALLCLFELQFLPYHGVAMVLWHRLAVVIDLVLIWLLWPSISGGAMVPVRTIRLRSRPGLIIATLAVLPLTSVVATFPGDPFDRFSGLLAIPWRDDDRQWHAATLHDYLVRGEIDLVARRPVSVFSNRLVVPDLDVIDHAKIDTEAKLAALPETLSLRGRDLEGAVLIGANLRKVDLSAADLSGAFLNGADLRDAKFDRVKVSGGWVSPHGCADRDTDMIDFHCTNLQGASLVGARLQGASLKGALLRGGLLEAADLRGADLRGAQLTGAWLGNAKLQAAFLDDSDLRLTSFYHADLRGAVLESAQAQGAQFGQADLTGASLDGADLRGADFDGAVLHDTSLKWVLMWRANIASAREATVRLELLHHDPVGPELLPNLVDLVSSEVPSDMRRMDALARLGPELDPRKPFDDADAIERKWAALLAASPDAATFNAALMSDWREIGCAMDGNPYVMRNLIKRLALNGPLSASRLPRPDASGMASAFLSTDCAGAFWISDEDRARLRALGGGSAIARPEPG